MNDKILSTKLCSTICVSQMSLSWVPPLNPNGIVWLCVCAQVCCVSGTTLKCLIFPQRPEEHPLSARLHNRCIHTHIWTCVLYQQSFVFARVNSQTQFHLRLFRSNASSALPTFAYSIPTSQEACIFLLPSYFHLNTLSAFGHPFKPWCG